MKPAAALGACAALLAGGCSESAQPEPVRQVLSAERVLQTPAGTPQRAVLAWWRAIQARDSDLVLRSLTARARSSLEPGIAQDVRTGLGPWSTRVAPVIVDVERTRRGATVYMSLKVRQRLGPGVSKPGEQLLALPLTTVRGRWLVDDSVWLRDQAERYSAR